MAILARRKVWKKTPERTQARYSTSLTAEEHERVTVALLVQRTRYRTLRELAAAMRAHEETVRLAMRKRRPSAALAIRIARLAGVDVGALLVGDWPGAGYCRHCGKPQ